MENNFYRDDFESFLKESADDFRMVPSRKVWYSIYNNMHPDRKWPSVAVCLIILSAVLFIGISNNNSLSESARLANESRVTSSGNQSSDIIIAELPKRTHASSVHIFRDHSGTNVSGNISEAENEYDKMPGDIDIAYAKQFTDAFADNDDADNTGSASKNSNTFSVPAKTNVSVTSPSAENDNISGKKKKSYTETASADSEVPDADALNTTSTSPFAVSKNKEAELLKKTMNPDKPWIEDYAFRNKPKNEGHKSRLSLGYYITPSFGYRAFYKNDQAKNSSQIANANLKDAAALNLEAGAAMMYKVSDKIILKAGLQINYTNYISKVTNIDHPTQARLATGNEVTNVRYSDYAVQEGYSRLNKTTMQLSMPIGADLKLLGNRKFKWYAGATLQPTYILGGSSYVLSQDAKNYISETPLLRRWNMNASLETFVSFKPSTGISVNVGPQFRYQLLSTYKKEYNYSEKLYNIGMKVGIVTNF